MTFPSFMKIIIIFLPIFVLMVDTTFAAMDPAEVSQKNSEAPYQITGEVISDKLFKDLTVDDNRPEQLRQMTVKIVKIEKASKELQAADTAEVIYNYIPAWAEEDYVGGKRMDITPGDVITIWLEDGKYGLEPVLGGYSVVHLTYIPNREEHISEPFWHGIKRFINDLGNTKSDVYIWSGLVLILGLTIFYGLRQKAYRG
jgi:hypothetical protein